MASGGKPLIPSEDELVELLDRQEMGEEVTTPWLWKVYRLWRRWGISPIELVRWPSWLVDAMMTCELVAARRSAKTVPPPR